MTEIQEWWRPHSVEAVAVSSQEGDGALTRLDRLDITTTPPIGTNLTVVSQAFARITATGDDRPRSVNRSYPQGGYAHSSQVINPLPIPVPWPFLFYRTSAEIFAMNYFCLFHRSHIMPAILTRNAGVIDAGEFLLFLPSLPHCIQHRKFFVYVPRNGKTALNWISDTFVTRTGDRFTFFPVITPNVMG
jgi:hypothetical protein